MKTVLVLAPHTDDGEIGCGATIAKLIESGDEVYYATFSVCEESVPEGLPKNILEIEVKKATLELGLKIQNLLIHRYPVRRFTEYRQQILDDLIRLGKRLSPDLVFMPSKHDVHQDHNLIAAEGLRAFKQTSILSYEMLWNNLTFETTAFCKLEKRHIDRKVKAIEQYTSQQCIRAYMKREFIEALARTRGVQIGGEYAETFEVVRWML